MLWAQTQPERAIITILTAYLACEDSLIGGVRDAIELVREYGFLTSTMRQANCADVSLSSALRLIGVIQLSAREFALSTHPYTVGHVGEHLRENEGWITTPELRDLLDSGDMMEATACEVVYWVGTKPSIKLPARDLAVRFVGKCARHDSSIVYHRPRIIIRDPNKAAYLCKTLTGFWTSPMTCIALPSRMRR